MRRMQDLEEIKRNLILQNQKLKDLGDSL